MKYLKLTPRNDLLHSIEAYCFYESISLNSVVDYFFPNGRCAIVFHLDKPFCFFNENKEWESMPKISLINNTLKPVYLQYSGNINTIAIIVFPHFPYNLFNIKLKLTNRPVDAMDFFCNGFFDKLQQTKSNEQKVYLLNNWFFEKINRYDPSKDLFGNLCKKVIMHNGMIERGKIADEYHISENYIHKIFTQRLGISFKPFSQVIRISAILKELSNNNNNDWFEIFEKYGYFDQSHFIKDFKKITDRTPSQYFKYDKSFSNIFSAFK